MDVQMIKQNAFAIALTLAFVILPGLSNLTAAQAATKKDKSYKEHRHEDFYRRHRHDDELDRRWHRRRRLPRLTWCYHHRRFEHFPDCYKFRR